MVRSERIQAAHLTGLLDVVESMSLDAASAYTFVTPDTPHRASPSVDLDTASYGLVKPIWGTREPDPRLALGTEGGVPGARPPLRPRPALTGVSAPPMDSGGDRPPLRLKFAFRGPMTGASHPRPCPERTRIVKRVITIFVVLDAAVLSAILAWLVR